MTMLPVASGATARDLGIQVALQSLARNPEDSALGMTAAAAIGSRVVTDIEESIRQSRSSAVKDYQLLKGEGLADDDPFVVHIKDSQEQITNVLLEMAQAVGRLIR